MYISTEFDTIPDEYAKYAPEENKVNGSTVVSFPFQLHDIDPSMKYLHWAFLDDGSIPVCGFTWIHWSLANLPIDAVMFAKDDPTVLQIPADFSRSVVSMMPEVLQGNNSHVSRFIGITDPNVAQRYAGPKPPNEDHFYMLRVWATKEPLQGLKQGFPLNKMYDALRSLGASIDLSHGQGIETDAILLRGRK